MGQTLTQKILQTHLVEGYLEVGEMAGIHVDSTLLQDATGTMACLEFEALGLPRVKTNPSVIFVDHNMLQVGFENPDDHIFLQTFAAKYGMYYSRPGNGICHQVYLERFAVPGKVLLGADSHSPTAGGMGMLAIGAGGLDVALAMAGQPFFLTMPKIVGVKLTGKLQPFVSAKDIILELLRRLTVKGGIGKIFEYYGEGIRSLTVPERSTITNMGAELGATTSLFPSDEVTKDYLTRQGRENEWIPLYPDEDAEYQERIEIDLSSLEPLIARPHSPDNVVKVREVKGLPVDQVAIGSCTNSSFTDLMIVAEMVKGRSVHPRVSAALTPGSRQVLNMIAASGALADFIASGFRVLESACGPCIGMGFAPPSGGVSIRSYNRNFEGRAGTKDARVYLASPEVCAACALTGEITDPRDLGIPYSRPALPEKYLIDDRMILPPSSHPEEVEVRKGPNIKSLPPMFPLPEVLDGEVLIKVGDNISTDHILPAGAKILPLRSNLPAISEYVFASIEPGFVKRAKEKAGGFIIGGENYGQGSSREHAALAPKYLGVKAVIVKSFARIHLANLINFGILPLKFANPSDYARVDPGDFLQCSLPETLNGTLIVKNLTKKLEIPVIPVLNARDWKIVKAGGSLLYAKLHLT